MSEAQTEEIYARISQLLDQGRAQLAAPESVEYWTAAAARKDAQERLWRQLYNALAGDVPAWSSLAVHYAATHCKDTAERYRQYARDVARQRQTH